jgi:6-phosphofructokinase
MPADVKYIDPTYMIRARPCNAADHILCTILGQNAVCIQAIQIMAFHVIWVLLSIFNEVKPRLMHNSEKKIESIFQEITLVQGIALQFNCKQHILFISHSLCLHMQTLSIL